MEKDYPKVYKQILKYLHMNSQQQINKSTKTDLFQWGLSRILLTTQTCIQNISISSNLREADLNVSSAWLLFWLETYVLKHLSFWFQQVMNFLKRS